MANENEQVVTAPTSLAEAAFGAVASPAEAVAQPTPEAVVPPVEKKDEVATPPVEESDLKKHLGYDDWEVAKTELVELRKLKDAPQTAAEIKYENELSKRLHEAIAGGKRKEIVEILSQQEQLEELSTVEINKDTAAKVVKAAMQFKYKDLTPSEIEYKFKKMFGSPDKPVQTDVDSDEDYALKVQAWENRVKEVEMDLMIEAKTVRPELEQHKSKLVLPDIQQAQPTVKELSEEDKAAFKKQQEVFLQSVDETLKSFSGFTTAVKDKDVDIPLAYGLSEDEKTEVSSMVKQFAESGFDANSIFATMWVKDGKIDTTKMVSDLSRLLAGDKVSQAIATDAANKRLEAYLKEKKNINVNETTTRGTFNPAPKEELDKVREAAFAS
jgi:hypothetical protein